MDTFVCLAVQGIFSILRQTHILKASILLLSFTFIVHVSAAYINTEKTSDRISLFLVPLEMFLLHVMFRRLVIAAFPRAIRRRVYANEPTLNSYKGVDFIAFA